MIIICRTDKHGGSGHYWHAREISFEWRFAGESIMALLYICWKGQDESAHMCRPIKAFATLKFTWIKSLT